MSFPESVWKYFETSLKNYFAMLFRYKIEITPFIIPHSLPLRRKTDAQLRNLIQFFPIDSWAWWPHKDILVVTCVLCKANVCLEIKFSPHKSGIELLFLGKLEARSCKNYCRLRFVLWAPELSYYRLRGHKAALCPSGQLAFCPGSSLYLSPDLFPLLSCISLFKGPDYLYILLAAPWLWGH